MTSIAPFGPTYPCRTARLSASLIVAVMCGMPTGVVAQQARTNSIPDRAAGTPAFERPVQAGNTSAAGADRPSSDGRFSAPSDAGQGASEVSASDQPLKSNKNLRSDRDCRIPRYPDEQNRRVSRCDRPDDQ
jgi:hypothetical protein